MAWKICSWKLQQFVAEARIHWVKEFLVSEETVAASVLAVVEQVVASSFVVVAVEELAF